MLYAAELRRFGIHVELRFVLGSLQNRRLLRDRRRRSTSPSCRADRATAAKPATTTRRKRWRSPSRSARWLRPGWIADRAESAKKVGKEALVTAIPQMRGWHVNVGVRGSGTPGITNRIFAANSVERDELKRSNLDDFGSGAARWRPRCGGAGVAARINMVQMLLQTPGIRLYEYAQARAMRGAIPSSAR